MNLHHLAALGAAIALVGACGPTPEAPSTTPRPSDETKTPAPDDPTALGLFAVDTASAAIQMAPNAIEDSAEDSFHYEAICRDGSGSYRDDCDVFRISTVERSGSSRAYDSWVPRAQDVIELRNFPPGTWVWWDAEERRLRRANGITTVDDVTLTNGSMTVDVSYDQLDGVARELMQSAPGGGRLFVSVWRYDQLDADSRSRDIGVTRRFLEIFSGEFNSGQTSTSTRATTDVVISMVYLDATVTAVNAPVRPYGTSEAAAGRVEKRPHAQIESTQYGVVAHLIARLTSSANQSRDGLAAALEVSIEEIAAGQSYERAEQTMQALGIEDVQAVVIGGAPELQARLATQFAWADFVEGIGDRAYHAPLIVTPVDPHGDPLTFVDDWLLRTETWTRRNNQRVYCAAVVPSSQPIAAWSDIVLDQGHEHFPIGMEGPGPRWSRLDQHFGGGSFSYPSASGEISVHVPNDNFLRGLVTFDVDVESLVTVENLWATETWFGLTLDGSPIASTTLIVPPGIHVLGALANSQHSPDGQAKFQVSIEPVDGSSPLYLNCDTAAD